MPLPGEPTELLQKTTIETTTSTVPQETFDAILRFFRLEASAKERFLASRSDPLLSSVAPSSHLAVVQRARVTEISTEEGTDNNGPYQSFVVPFDDLPAVSQKVSSFASCMSSRALLDRKGRAVYGFGAITRAEVSLPRCAALRVDLATTIRCLRLKALTVSTHSSNGEVFLEWVKLIHERASHGITHLQLNLFLPVNDPAAPLDIDEDRAAGSAEHPEEASGTREEKEERDDGDEGNDNAIEYDNDCEEDNGEGGGESRTDREQWGDGEERGEQGEDLDTSDGEEEAISEERDGHDPRSDGEDEGESDDSESHSDEEDEEDEDFEYVPWLHLWHLAKWTEALQYFRETTSLVIWTQARLQTTGDDLQRVLPSQVRKVHIRYFHQVLFPGGAVEGVRFAKFVKVNDAWAQREWKPWIEQ